MNKEDIMRGLLKVWTDFDSSLNSVPLIEKLNQGNFRIQDYKRFLLNHRQQVIEGSRWIARAASSIDKDYVEIRNKFLSHAITEHKDYEMLEQNYTSIGGALIDIQTATKNIGSEALHGYMMYKASMPNPFDLLGAMFIIEGLGQKKAGEWGHAIKDQLGLKEDQVSFLLYHSEHDDDHMEEFDELLSSEIIDLPKVGSGILKTAKVIARLYKLQLEEQGSF
jgi:3-oxoacyl-[acyl-carrier-protein] synthase-3